MVNDKSLKETFLKLFIKGRSKAEVEDIVNSFFRSKLRSMINDVVFKKLKNHINSGHKVYIASANFDFFLEPLKKKWGFDGIISTETESKDGCFTGKIIGNTCKGKNKLKKLEEIFGVEKLKNAIAYADKEDSYLLDNVKRGIKIS